MPNSLIRLAAERLSAALARADAAEGRLAAEVDHSERLRAALRQADGLLEQALGHLQDRAT